jgi:hypothetical protein
VSPGAARWSRVSFRTHTAERVGETGVWNPTLFGWQSEDGSFKDSTFALPGTDMSSEELGATVERLVQLAWTTESPDFANTLQERARDLRERSHDPEHSRYAYP